MKKLTKPALFVLGVVALLLAFKININLDLLFNVVVGFLLFISVMMPLVIIHEFAHFVVGKKLGAEPEVFSIGMGKKLWGFKFMDTDFIVSLLPLGGYVKFKKVQFEGENGDGTPNEQIAPWRWFFIALAGPLSNFVLAFVVFFGLFFYGSNFFQVGKVDNSTIVVLTESKGQIPNFVHIITKTEETSQVFELTNKLTASSITKEEALSKTSPLSLVDKTKMSFNLSLDLFSYFFKLTAQSLGKLVTNLTQNYHQVSSPIGIAQQVKYSVDAGWLYIVIIFGSLSFGLGFMNMLPLSILDGGRCVMAVYQSLIKKEIPVKALNLINSVSMVLILSLMLIGLFSDLMRNSGYKNKEKTKQEEVVK